MERIRLAKSVLPIEHFDSLYELIAPIIQVGA